MAIQFIPFQDIDLIRYDGCVKNAHNSTPFGYSWYLKSIVGQFDILMTGDYDVVMPLPYYNLRLGGKSIVHHPLTSRLGIYSKKTLANDAVKNFVNAIPEDFKNIQLFFNHGNLLKEDIEPYTRVLHRIFTLNMQSDYHSLSHDFSDEVIAAIEYEQENNSLSTIELDIEEAVKYFAQFTRIKSWSLSLHTMLEEARTRGLLYPLHLADKDGNIHSISYFLKENRKVTQLVLASANAEPHPQIISLDMIVRELATQMKTLDLNTIQAILAENFGAKPQEFYSLTHLRKREKWLHSLGLNIYKGTR